MATDVERLVVSLEASITKYERAMQRAVGQTNQTAKRIEDRFAKTSKDLNRRFDQMGVGMSLGLAKAFAGAAALQGASRLIDASTRITNSLKVAGLSGEDLTRVYDELYASAQRNAAPVESLVQLYGRAAIVQNELGVSTEELLGFTDNVAVALRVAGTDAQSASGALLQLSQALGAGTVRAEEFNSILEGALPIAQAAAAGLDEAGGSVAKLRALVVDGKVSSEAFFRAFEAGSVILQEKVAGSELTVSQSFVRLQNVLIDAAGKFDKATGASQDFARFLDGVGQAVDRLGENERLGKILQFLNDFGDAQFDATAREFEAIGGAIEGAVQYVEGLGSSAEGAAGRLVNLETSAANVLAKMLGFASIDLVPPDQRAQIEAFIDDLGNAEIASDELMQKLRELGGLSVNFAIVNDLQGLRGELIATRSEALATAAALAAAASGQTSSGNIADQRAEQNAVRASAPKPAAVATVKPVSIADYAVPASSSGGGSKGGKGGGGGKSASDRFGEALEDQQRRIAELQRETELRRQLGVVFDENGHAMQRLRVQMDLENAAAEAGLALTPERQAAINALADGYAAASVEAAKLAEAQDQARETMQEWFDTGRGVMQGFIDDLIAGKDAADVLSNALSQVGSALINMGMNSMFGSGSGSSPFGMIGKLFGFASGTANTGGVRGQPRGIVHGQEAVIPLPAGGRVPVDIRMPTLPTQGAQSSGPMTIHVSIDGANGDQHVIDLVQQGVSAGLKQYDSMMKPRVQGILAQTKQSGPRGLRG